MTDFSMKNRIPGGRIYPVDYPSKAAARYGDFAPTPKVYRIALDAARDGAKMGIGGSFIWAYKASDTRAEVDIQFNNEVSDKMTFQVGSAIGGFRFAELFVSNDAQAGKWVDFWVIDQAEGINLLNPANVFTSVSLANQSTLASVADVTVTAAAAAAVVLAANADRKSALIQSQATNTQDVRLGDSNTGAARGLILAPGDTMQVDVTDDIYAYTAAGSDQKLSIVYTED
jgi:hypothetical protein